MAVALRQAGYDKPLYLDAFAAHELFLPSTPVGP